MTTADYDRWASLTGGYRKAFDPRPLIARLNTEPDTTETWQELWEELHHQGDVGEASYAAVPLLVDAYRYRHTACWNTYAIVAVIELARTGHGNPPLPEWLQKEYFESIQELATLGATAIMRANENEAVRAMLSIIAIAKGLRTHGRFLIEYSADELLELDSRQ
jgi:hypothetical protein